MKPQVQTASMLRVPPKPRRLIVCLKGILLYDCDYFLRQENENVAVETDTDR